MKYLLAACVMFLLSCSVVTASDNKLAMADFNLSTPTKTTQHFTALADRIERLERERDKQKECNHEEDNGWRLDENGQWYRWVGNTTYYQPNQYQYTYDYNYNYMPSYGYSSGGGMRCSSRG